jgi:hypothetical protein
MSLPPGGYEDVSGYYCTCEKYRCGSRGPRGTLLPRTTWYNHNSGGKTAKIPELSQEQIAAILARPTPTYSKRRKRRLEVEGVAGPSRTSKRLARSNSVRAMSDQDICTFVQRYSRKRRLRVPAPVRETLMDVKRPQNSPVLSVLQLHPSLSSVSIHLLLSRTIVPTRNPLLLQPTT